MPDPIPPEVLEDIPEHLRPSAIRCDRCRRVFVPVGGNGRTRCVACVRRDRADCNLIRMASGKES